MVSPVLIDGIGWQTYLIFMCLLVGNCFLAISGYWSLTQLQISFCPIIYFYYPETSNLGLEEIDQIFLPESMGGLNGNARKRLTREAADQRRRSVGMSKDEISHLQQHVEKV